MFNFTSSYQSILADWYVLPEKKLCQEYIIISSIEFATRFCIKLPSLTAVILDLEANSMKQWLGFGEFTQWVNDFWFHQLKTKCALNEPLKNEHTYSRVSNNSVDTLIKTALDFPWWFAYLIPPRLLKFSKFSILYIPTDVILRCLTRYRVTRSFIRLTVRPFFGGFSRSRLHSGVQYKSFIASIWFMPPNTMKLHR